MAHVPASASTRWPPSGTSGADSTEDARVDVDLDVTTSAFVGTHDFTGYMLVAGFLKRLPPTNLLILKNGILSPTSPCS